MSDICETVGVNVDLEFECIYKKVELKHLSELPKLANGLFDPEEEEDIMYLCEEVYREEFLKFFRVTSFEEGIINKHVNKLFELVKGNEMFSKMLDTISSKSCIFEEDMELAFMQLFSYQFFYLTHECIKQLIEPNESRDMAFEKLENAVKMFGTE